MFYRNRPETKDNKCFYRVICTVSAIKSLLELSLGMFNNRCDTMHGIDEEDAKQIKRTKILGVVKIIYSEQESLAMDFCYFFDKEGVTTLCKCTTQYLIKWVTSF